MDQVLRRAAKLFTMGTNAPEAFRIAQAEYDVVEAAQTILDLKWPWVLEALGDPMDYEEPTSQYVDSRDSAEAPAIQ